MLDPEDEDFEEASCLSLACLLILHCTVLYCTVLYLCCEGGSWQWVGRGTGSWARGLQSAQRLGGET